MNQQTDERYELYKRFKKEVSEASAEIFYDEKELVEIFDIAGDYDDDYVRLEVLLHGFRLYPQSEDLAVRRGYFYYDINVDDGVRTMLGNNAHVSFLWDLMRIRTGMCGPGNLNYRLDELLAASSDLDDEEIIQLVDCASAVGEYEWLKKNMGALRAHCGYLPTLLYEMHVVASMNQDSETAIKMLEELTEIEPFNAEFWSQLSEEQLKAGKESEAEVSADYAIAIDADDYRPKVCKAKALMAQNKCYQDVVSMLEPVSSQCSDDLAYVQALSIAYMNTGEQERAEQLLLDYNRNHPDEKAVVDYLLLIHYKDVCDVLDEFYNSTARRSETEWVEWAQSHRAAGQYAEAALIMECFDRNEGIKSNLQFYYSVLYEAKFYRVITHFFSYYMRPENRASLLPELAITGVLSYIRLGMREEGMRCARELLSFYRGGGGWSVSRVLASIGLVTSLSMIVREMDKNPDVDTDDLDTFMPPPAAFPEG